MPVYKDRNGTWYVKYKNRTKRGFKRKVDGQRYLAQLQLESVTDSNCTSIYLNL